MTRCDCLASYANRDLSSIRSISRITSSNIDNGMVKVGVDVKVEGEVKVEKLKIEGEVKVEDCK